MKTLVISLFLVLTFFYNSIAQKADSVKFFQKVTAGVILGTFASTSFSSNKPFELGYNLSPHLTIITPKTFHMVLYGFGNNSLRSLNGYFLKNNWDVYCIFSKILHTRDCYLGCGIEKMILIENKKKTAGIKCFLFSEVGSDLRGTNSLSLGLLINTYGQVWKRK